MTENVEKYEIELENDGSSERDINFFLTDEVELEEIEVIVSERFKNQKGKVVPFVLKEINQELMEEIERECMKPVYAKKARKNVKIHEDLDTRRYLARLMVEVTVFPNFKSQEMRHHYKYEDAVEGLKKVLPKPSEYNTLMTAVMDLLGLDEDVDELEEAKN